MELTESAADLRRRCDEARAAGARVALVPTMGDLHAGHESLIRRAGVEAGFVVVSVFVNALQFDSKEDLAGYPRGLDADRAMAERLGVDLVFAPSDEEMYPDGAPTVWIDPGPLGDRWEGASRPGHFRGVLTVVSKLFHLVGPARAYFGEKDAQQLAVIRRMVADLDVPVAVVGCPIVREADGLAMSSRNSYLDPAQRAAAPVLHRALQAARAALAGGERSGDALRALMRGLIDREPQARVDYASVADPATFQELDRVTGPALALLAVRFGATRLIDNLLL